jgi:hypothetical protein
VHTVSLEGIDSGVGEQPYGLEAGMRGGVESCYRGFECF